MDVARADLGGASDMMLRTLVYFHCCFSLGFRKRQKGMKNGS